jgi:hypothetical protein
MALLVGIELDGILGALFAVPVAGILYVISMAVYYNLTGRERPEPVRKPANSVWLAGLTNNLSSKALWRPPIARPDQPRDDTAVARITSARLRRLTKGNVPERLANVEQARDVLLRDKLQRRQIAHAEAEAREAAASAHDPEQPELFAESDHKREQERSARAR